MAGASGWGGERGEDEAAPGHEPAAVSSGDAVDDAAWSDEPLETGRLGLGDEDVRLPWLEGDGDDEKEYRGYSGAQVLVLFLLGLLAMAVIGGGVWWALHQRQDDVLVADGSVIRAPEKPYKEAPKDPGGKTFAGTGDTSFAVSEGQTRPARLGRSEAPATPVEAPSPGAGAKPSAAAEPAQDLGGVGVQVAAYSSRSAAEAGWTRLSGQYEVLSGLKHRVVEGSADIGTVYRLQVVAGGSSEAHALCGRLKSAGLACQVKN